MSALAVISKVFISAQQLHLSLRSLLCFSAIIQKSVSLLGLNGSRQLGSENGIPELAGDTETKLVVEEVVLKVVLLELLIPEWKVLVMKEVVREIVANIAEDAAAEDSSSSIPAIGQDSMR